MFSQNNSAREGLNKHMLYAYCNTNYGMFFMFAQLLHGICVYHLTKTGLNIWTIWGFLYLFSFSFILLYFLGPMKEQFTSIVLV